MNNLAVLARVQIDKMIALSKGWLLPGILALAPVAWAQAQLLTKPDDPGVLFRSDTRLVVCHTTVTDKDGHFVTDLPQSAFTVSENGVRQQMRSFLREDVPVALGLVIDNSASMTPRRAQVEAASLALVEASNPQDEVFVVNFNDEIYFDMPTGVEFTHDLDLLKKSLKRIDSRGGTAMRDAIQKSMDHLKLAHRDKKVLVVITDGDDNFSAVEPDELIKSAQQAGVLIYSIGLLAEEEPRAAAHAKHYLEELARATGASAFFAKDVTEVDRLGHQVAQDIRNQYIIQYTPANQIMDGKFRTIKISVKASGAAVRTRPGYWATAVPAGK